MTENLNEKQHVYVLEEYPFYEGSNIIMISKKYTKTKEKLLKLPKKLGYGYRIRKYELDKDYTIRINAESIIWIELDYDGEIRNFKM